MARSKTGGKSSGYEFWSRRPMVFWAGSWAKTKCHRIERQQSREIVRNELKHLE